ncbi:uncharacterized protein LOC133814245 [Humulus lupulus]|uniref:uncharacterized protein LOC133814245 n=1 Tax=Humulus lupulus TaxID=3486 RepID=UPI002B40D1B0|nr:uncharacterized protein LOC133814245 [Humulus lupulus]
MVMCIITISFMLDGCSMPARCKLDGTSFFTLHVVLDGYSIPTRCKLDGSTVYVFVSYNGVWEMHGRKWYFKDAEGEVIPVENDVTYLQLLDILHETFQVGREVYELKLEVPYVCGEQPFAPVQLKNDRQILTVVGD